MTTNDQDKGDTPSSTVPDITAIHSLGEQVKFGHQAWIERLREMQAIETQFTRELLAARDPNAALNVCNRWISKRLELLTADSKAFTGFWMDLIMTAAGTRKDPERKQGE